MTALCKFESNSEDIMDIAIITGSSSGLGRSYAKNLDLSQYDKVWLVARRREVLEEIASIDSKYEAVVLDIGNSEEVIAFENKIKESGVRIKLLINCAGMGKRGTLEGNEVKDTKATLDLNCTGLALMTRICIPYMMEGGGIINVSSSAAFLPQPGFNVYAASKSFVLNLSRALSYELKAKKINVTCVCSGPIATEFLKKALNDPNAEFTGIRAMCVADPDKLSVASIKANKRGRKVLVYGFMQKLLHVASKLVPTDLILWLETSVFKVNG
ncbi:MAG: SDR family NAD(P)-dependent oxidoreductase [Clostridia bacterium]|nr:SDR family NAD(P)-dependent oxidoreductase [Clostridia bacterium]